MEGITIRSIIRSEFTGENSPYPSHNPVSVYSWELRDASHTFEAYSGNTFGLYFVIPWEYATLFNPKKAYGISFAHYPSFSPVSVNTGNYTAHVMNKEYNKK